MDPLPVFLYPPSEDAVVQVTALAFESCSIGDPILKMDDGNSLFNITSPGEFYFTSGVAGRCEKNQRLRISTGGGNGTSSPAADSPAGALPGTSAAYPTVFGPTPPSSSAPPPPAGIPMAAASALLALLFHSLCG